MAIAFDSYESGVNTGSGCIIDVPTNTQNGDLLILTLNNDDAAAISPGVGWTEIEYPSAYSSAIMGLWYRVADSEPGNYNFGSSTQLAGIIALFTESSAGTWSISDSGFDNSGADVVSVSGVTASSGDLLIVGHGNDDNGTPSVDPVDMIEIITLVPGSTLCGMWYELGASAQNYTKGLTATGNNAIVLAAIHFVSSGGSTLLPNSMNTYLRQMGS